MASLFKLGNLWACDVYGYGRIRLGKLKGDAGHNFRFIESIEQSKRHGVELSPAAVDWLRNTAPRLRKRLAHIGLIDDRSGRTLGDLLEAFKSQPGKESSKRIRTNAADKIETFFGSTTPLSDIKPADAQAYRNWLATKGKDVAKGAPEAGLGSASVARQVKWARTVFNIGQRFQWVGANPFRDVKAGNQVNSSKAFFVSPEIAERVSAQIPTAIGRLMFALGRWGGVRMPSELVGFRWSGVDWVRWSMIVVSPKTEAYEGHESRTVPIFRELQPYFVAARVEADQVAKAKGESDFVFADLRRAKLPRQEVAQIIVPAIRRAGLKPWPRLLSNLRATRATEVDKQFGSKCESEWIGHGAVTALKHYLMILDDDWLKATGVIRF